MTVPYDIAFIWQKLDTETRRNRSETKKLIKHNEPCICVIQSEI